MSSTLATRHRSAIVIDSNLPPGLAANAAAIVGISLGRELPDLVGASFADGSGAPHVGLIATGLPVLAAPASELGALRAAGLAAGLLVIDLPAAGQQTTDYEEFRSHLGATDGPDVAYLAVLLSGAERKVRKLTAPFSLLS